MTQLMPGSYVTHSKLPELGSGEVLSLQNDKVLIRFASGERSFQIVIAGRFFSSSTEAPAAPAKKSRATKATKAPKKKKA